jgi:myo-inositol-1-phosphate synthase
MAPHALTGSPAFPNGDGYNTPASVDYAEIPIHPTAARRAAPVIVRSDTASYTDSHITSKYEYRSAHVVQQADRIEVVPTTQRFEFKTERKVQKTGSVNVLPLCWFF